MFVPTSPSSGPVGGADAGARTDTSPAPSRIPMRGGAELRVRARDGQTALDWMHQEAPCRVLFPLREPGEPLQAVLVNISGGMVGGDAIRQQIEVAAGARCQVMTQAAEKIYRAPSDFVSMETTLDVARGGFLEWMPLPAILFNGARLRRQTTVHLQAGCHLMAGEITILGRHAHGERLTDGAFQDRWDVMRDGDLVWSDRTRVDDWPSVSGHPFAYARSEAAALMIYAAPDAASLLETARALLEDLETPVGATHVGGLLVLRWLAPDASALLRDYGRFWAAFRQAAGFGAASVPRIWNI